MTNHHPITFFNFFIFPKVHNYLQKDRDFPVFLVFAYKSGAGARKAEEGKAAAGICPLLCLIFRKIII